MTLPKASELDVWLDGSIAARIEAMRPQTLEIFKDPRWICEHNALVSLNFHTLRWLRANNDRVAFDVPELPELERRYSAATTTEAKREALRALLAARDRVVANTPKHDALQAQAVQPLQLGLHPTGHAME